MVGNLLNGWPIRHLWFRLCFAAADIYLSMCVSSNVFAYMYERALEQKGRWLLDRRVPTCTQIHTFPEARNVQINAPPPSIGNNLGHVCVRWCFGEVFFQNSRYNGMEVTCPDGPRPYKSARAAPDRTCYSPEEKLWICNWIGY